MKKSPEQKIDLFIDYLERKGLDYSYGESINGDNIFITDWNALPDQCESWVESLGYEIWWSDTSVMCENCYKWVYTQPGYYGDIPQYTWLPDHVSCTNCIKEDIKEYGLDSDYLEYFIDNTNGCLNNNIISTKELIDLGFTLTYEDLECGFHPGQDDTTESTIDKYMGYHGIKSMPSYVFYIDGVGQFDVSFSLYVLLDKEDF